MVLVAAGAWVVHQRGFAGNIARREVLLRYTNRYYLPEYAAYLEPTLENVARMEKQKADCMGSIDEMAAALEEAKPHLTRRRRRRWRRGSTGSGTLRSAIRRWM